MRDLTQSDVRPHCILLARKHSFILTDWLTDWPLIRYCMTQFHRINLMQYYSFVNLLPQSLLIPGMCFHSSSASLLRGTLLCGQYCQMRYSVGVHVGYHHRLLRQKAAKYHITYRMCRPLYSWWIHVVFMDSSRPCIAASIERISPARLSDSNRRLANSSVSRIGLSSCVCECDVQYNSTDGDSARDRSFVVARRCVWNKFPALSVHWPCIEITF